MGSHTRVTVEMEGKEIGRLEFLRRHFDAIQKDLASKILFLPETRKDYIK
jgi:hypothetical protein